MTKPSLLLSVSLLAACSGADQPAPPAVDPRPAPTLALEVITSPEAAGAVTSTLITGPRSVVVVDAQFTRSGATAVADAVERSGKPLAAVFITHAHPDHYLGTAVLAARFPDTRFVATADVVAEMQATASATAAARKDMLGAEFPGEPVIPTAITELSIDGVAITLMPGLAGDTHPITGLYLDALGTLIASDVAYADVHLWTATTDHAGRLAWAAQTRELEALPGLTRVIPGHQLPDSAQTPAALAYTRAYITDFDEAAANAATPADLIATMKAKHPVAAALFLELGAPAALAGNDR